MRGVWGIALFWVGCLDAEVVTLPEAPSGALARVVAFEGAEGRLEVYASEPDDGMIEPIVGAGEKMPRVWVAYFTSDLESLNLRVGRVEPYDGKSCAPRELPAPSSLEIWDSGHAEVVDVRETPLDTFTYLGSCPCKVVSRRALEVGGVGRRLIPASDGGRTAVIYQTDQAGVVTEHTVEHGEIVRSQIVASNEVVISAFVDDEGRAWTGMERGRLFRGSEDGTLEYVLTASPAGDLAAIAGTRGDNPFELYFVTGGSPSAIPRLWRYSGDGLEAQDVRSEPGFMQQKAGVVWLGPGRALASLPDAIDLVEVNLPAAFTERFWTENLHEVVGLTSSPSFGVAVLSIAAVWTREREDWRVAATLGVDGVEVASPSQIASVGSGLFVIGKRGTVAQIYPDWERCPLTELGVPSDEALITVLEDGIVMTGLDLRDRQNVAANASWVEFRDP